ncbi:hypothetical protein NHU_00412 [Rhodovulum sulfidophilum]|uniref:Uncharacterized protein n=1 Tax=Rhodovulum sulfidophilum TaxID=35806 RepID=A0A0D6AXI0_RHOSU|nr:hypothetical protein NHU_00412 [Rhodovulum sulfidophilum]
MAGKSATLWPGLRRPIAPGDAVAMRAHWGTWALAGPKTALSVSQARLRTRALQLMEAR